MKTYGLTGLLYNKHKLLPRVADKDEEMKKSFCFAIIFYRYITGTKIMGGTGWKKG
ncbi:MAG: hypothetical protein AB1633_13555 [Elusimicrobiota bacterium]